MLCEVLYVVLSPMDGYHAQGTLSRVSTESYEKGIWECTLVFTKLTYSLKSGYVARVRSQKQYTTEVFRELGERRCLHCVQSVLQS